LVNSFAVLLYHYEPNEWLIGVDESNAGGMEEGGMNLLRYQQFLQSKLSSS
jgi:hypothetical protein